MGRIQEDPVILIGGRSFDGYGKVKEEIHSPGKSSDSA